jgi:hypothetical protein
MLNSVGFTRYANISEIKQMDFQKNSNNNSKLIREMLQKLNEKESQINTSEIIEKYNKIFNKNMIYKPYDAITSDQLEKCLDTVVLKLNSEFENDKKKKKNTEYLLLNDDALELRSDLFYLKNKLPIYIGAKIIEKIIVNIYRGF